MNDNYHTIVVSAMLIMMVAIFTFGIKLDKLQTINHMAVTKCEAELPRNQSCELVITARPIE